MSSELMKFFADLEKAKKNAMEGTNQEGIQRKKFNDVCSMKPSNSQQGPVSKTSMSPSLDVTFLSILNNGCSRNNWSPLFETVQTNELNDCFKMRCTVKNMVGYGKAKSKKAAKQIAAKEILLQVVEGGDFSGFDVGATKEKAIQYLNSLSAKADVDEDPITSSTENWVGKLFEYCLRLKINSPEYEYEEKVTPQGPLFIATCTVGKIKCTGEARQKKQAKSVAARKMFLRAEDNDLEKMGKDDSMLAANFLKAAAAAPTENTKRAPKDDNTSASFSGGESTADSELNSSIGDGSEKDMFAKIPFELSEETLCSFLSSEDAPLEKIFAKQEPVYVVFNKKSVSGEIQCLMELSTPEGESCVFPGWGLDLETARNCACDNALLYAKTFLS